MMTLADAIRAGCQQSVPRQFDFVIERHTVFGVRLEACALGAAAIGIGRPELGFDSTPGSYYELFSAVWPELGFEVAECPYADCENYVVDLYSCITHLNDDHEWTREAIADWLDSQVLEFPAVAVGVEAKG